MSLNDRGWGNKPDPGGNKGGPPDLEELWRDINRRLAGLFGKKGGGGGIGGGPSAPFNMRQFSGGIGLLLVVVLAVWLASGFYIVEASQRGVVLTFGRYSETTQPGLHWRMPYPIQSNEIVRVSDVRVVEVGYRGSAKNPVLKEALMLTDDENIVSIEFAVQWFVKDPQAYLFNNRSPDDAVLQSAETAMREVVGKSKMDFVLYEGREQVAAQASKLMQEILDRYKTGIYISRLTLQNVQPPEQVQAAFDDAVKAGQDRDRQVNEGQAYANDVVPRARGAASRLFEEASGYKSRVIANAEGDASRFSQILTQYDKAPAVTRSRMYLDTMQHILSNTSKIMIDAKGGNNLLYLPLDKLMQAAGAPAAAAPAAASAPPPVPASPVQALPSEVPPQLDRSDASLLRSRDALRSRDRGER
ncbi:modulator of FtsH protease HflK [mine drainage metagenome]|uniref:Modulator of FtsH protease HflK n=1 Tax=mine drainage metagenome TaxID=410659 RepID=A0A1J5S4U7_9ZZZZ